MNMSIKNYILQLIQEGLSVRYTSNGAGLFIGEDSHNIDEKVQTLESYGFLDWIIEEWEGHLISSTEHLHDYEITFKFCQEKSELKFDVAFESYDGQFEDELFFEFYKFDYELKAPKELIAQLDNQIQEFDYSNIIYGFVYENECNSDCDSSFCHETGKFTSFETPEVFVNNKSIELDLSDENLNQIKKMLKKEIDKRSFSNYTTNCNHENVHVTLDPGDDELSVSVTSFDTYWISEWEEMVSDYDSEDT